MNRFDHRFYIYLPLHIELPTPKNLIEWVTVTCQLIEIGFKCMVWELAGNIDGKSWRKVMGGLYEPKCNLQK
jgi:hypothetical protein